MQEPRVLFSMSYDDDFPSLPSMPTVRAGDPDALGRIDHYDLFRKLGGGGFGVVYLARDTASGVAVAIKTLHPLLKANAEEMDALREKFRLVSRLTHTNIAKALVLHPVHDVNVWDEAARQELRLFPGDSVMVMDYAPGVTLSRWRRQFPDGVVPLDEALEVGRQLASALDYAHGERIVHRAIKPANVMVETLPPEASPPARWAGSREGQSAGGASCSGEPPLVTPKIRVRILDFGVAAEIRSSMSRVSSETGDTSRMRPYMAPEQWLGRKQDGRTDQYALACVLYELLSGAPPFAGVFETGDPAIMKDAVVRDAPEEIEGVPPHVNAALRKALAKDPKERFDSCVAFVAALAASTDPSPQTSTRTPVPESRVPQGTPVADETELFLRQAKLEKTMVELWKDHVSDQEVLAVLSEADAELFAGQNALENGRVPTAAAYFGKVESALARIDAIKARRNVAAEGKAREEAERKARIAAERRAREEAERRAREEAERKAREEAERKACEEAEAERKRKAVFKIVALSLSILLALGAFWVLKNWASRAMAVSKLESMMVPIPGKEYMISKYEVTQGLWLAVMGENPSSYKGMNRPVENVSWHDCQKFLKKLNALPDVLASGRYYRLPTADEWEFACRAGATGDYCKLSDGTEVTRKTLGDVAWYGGNRAGGDETHPVGRKSPNAFGLYDMHGNVWEWTSTVDVGNRFYCGGSWRSAPGGCEAGYRFSNDPDIRFDYLGFRLAANK